VSPERRRVLAGIGLTALLPKTVLAAAQRAARGLNVAVVGGGFAGATCARALRRLAPDLRVSLIEPRTEFFTGPMSNAAIAGLLPLSAIRYSPAGLAAAGVPWIPQRVVALDPMRRQLRLGNGQSLAADHLVLAPGIQPRLDTLEGFDAEAAIRCPSGWLGDGEVSALRDRIAALPDGATVLISAPPLPYRCPPGPYERAALIAWSAQQQGKKIRVRLLDSKDDFPKRSAFLAGWERHYPGVIEWRARSQGGAVVRVDAGKGMLQTLDGHTHHGELLSVIPPQSAPQWLIDAGLADETGWCPVNAQDFRSTAAPGLRVIGDAAKLDPVPKSAFAAQAQAELCALALVAELAGETLPPGLLVNTCYSLLHPEHAISVAASFQPVQGRFNRLSEGSSGPDLPPEVGTAEARDAMQWYRQATQRAFGASALP